ncbi:hypothetical protein Lalb_Chr20g0114921 [Lupinus albus]|uniref:Uncharacterized protein n=1 Tax=Lupinus albus TaxID=3870 RepID=A0A6A4NQB9_LUPAL|nr:hypothetical protein Lalb_Chr20g0114921 [Lupinus albus]
MLPTFLSNSLTFLSNLSHFCHLFSFHFHFKKNMSHTSLTSSHLLRLQKQRQC